MLNRNNFRIIKTIGSLILLICVLFCPDLLAGERGRNRGYLTQGESVNKLTNKDKIEILLKEYDVLRTEISQRLSARMSFLGLWGALLGLMLFRGKKSSGFQIFILILGLVILMVVWLQLGRIVTRCSVRVADIEQQVNDLAGEDLLVWETRQTQNELHGFNRIFRKEGR